MQTPTSYNYDCLNHYFTSEEFQFINNANSENLKLDDITEKEAKTRDIIVNFINNLNDSISDIQNDKSNVEFLQLLSEVQDVFEKINDNIKMTHDLKLTSSEISDKIIELLINIESNPNNPALYEAPIQDLKNLINDFSQKSESVKSKVLLNDIKIETFLQKSIVKKYLSSFDIEVNISSKQNSSIKPTDSTFQISTNIDENDTLLVSEKKKKVFLPYTQKEISLYLEQYPNEYSSAEDVIKKEFILSLDYYMKHPVLARFREAYSLIRDRESKSIVDALKFALDIMFHYELNPVIIAACKTQEQLENYMSCLEKNNLDNFKDFKIKFEVSPLHK